MTAWLRASSNRLRKFDHLCRATVSEKIGQRPLSGHSDIYAPAQPHAACEPNCLALSERHGRPSVFANRHSAIAWFAKMRGYHFNLGAVWEPFDKTTKEKYLRNKRLKSGSIEKGKNATNVWEIARLDANSRERVGHPTQNPLELIRRPIRALPYPSSTVLDFLVGSASTTRVVIEEDRHSIAIDISPEVKIHLASQMEGLRRTNSRFFSPNSKFRLIPESEFLLHPAFNGG